MELERYFYKPPTELDSLKQYVLCKNPTNSIVSKPAEQYFRENDYFNEDGVLFCSRCHQPRVLLTIVYCGVERPPYPYCKCNEKNKEENKAKSAEKAIEDNRTNCFGDNKGFASYRFENSDRKDTAYMAAMNFVDHWEEYAHQKGGLFFRGNTGTGKTFYAACIANALLDKGVKVRMLTSSELLELAMEKNPDYKKLTDFNGLVIVDDLGAERDTSTANEKILRYVNSRSEQGKPIVFTSNLRFEDFPERLCSRLKESWVSVPVNGPDRRAEKGKERLERFKEMLHNEAE